MREPEFIEHDGAKVCPVPAGHDVEVRLRCGDLYRGNSPEAWTWKKCKRRPDLDITHYRDWTAFEQNSAGEVPEWALERAKYLRDRDVGLHPLPAVYAFARYIAAHEPEPVDPMVGILADSFEAAFWALPRKDDLQLNTPQLIALAQQLRARGVTMEKNNG